MRIGLTSGVYIHSHCILLHFTTHKRLTNSIERRSHSHVGSKLNYSQPCNIFVISSKKWEKRKRKWELFPTFIQNACILKCLFVYKRSSVIIFLFNFLAQGMYKNIAPKLFIRENISLVLLHLAYLNICAIWNVMISFTFLIKINRCLKLNVHPLLNMLWTFLSYLNFHSTFLPILLSIC